MKILAPVDHLEEVNKLIEAGADELYAGFVPPEWEAKYTLVGSINKRGYKEAQFSQEADLKKAVEIAHQKNAAFLLTLNVNYYSEEQYEFALKEVERAIDLGIDALIVTDIGLILKIRKEGFPIPLKISVASGVLNPAVVRFYRKLRIESVVLDRTLSVDEIGEIIESSEGISFDVFVMLGLCPNIESFCSFAHYKTDISGMPCVEGYSFDFTNKATANHERWKNLERLRGCGLCALYDFKHLGVGSLKIVGRGFPTPVKLKAIEALSFLRKLLEDNPNITREDFLKEAQSAHKKIQGQDCNPYCYHPYFSKI